MERPPSPSSSQPEPSELGGGARRDAPSPRAPRRIASTRIGPLAGLAYPLRGARLIYREQLQLARYWAPPLVLAAFSMGFAVWLVLDHRNALIAMVWPTVPTDAGFVGVALRASYWLVSMLVTIGALGLSLVLATFAAQLVGAPFHDALSEAVEALHSGVRAPTLSLPALARDALRSVQLVVVKLALFVALMLPLGIVSLLVPVVGPLLYAGLGFALTVAFVALDHVDWAAARHGFSVCERLALLRAHPLAMAGFGACAWAMLFVPLLNLLLTPAAVAGGTLLFLEMTSTLSQHEATKAVR